MPRSLHQTVNSPCSASGKAAWPQKKSPVSVGSGYARKSLHAHRLPSKAPPSPCHAETETALMALVTAVRDAEEVFETLNRHTDSGRQELLALLTRLRGRPGWQNTLATRNHRLGLHLTSQELAELAACRSGLYRSPAGQMVRAIVNAARNRCLKTDAALASQRTELSLTGDELLDLTDLWAGLPFDFEDKLKQARSIHRAAKERQTIQSGFSMIRAARAFMEATRRDATNPADRRRFTPQEINLARTHGERLRDSYDLQLADAMLQQAWERYSATLAAGNQPIGLMLSASDLSQLNQWRDNFLAGFEDDLHQLRMSYRQPVAGIRVMRAKKPASRTSTLYALRLDGSQAATTIQLSGLQFWGEFLLESYYLTLPFAVMITL
ncbi:hypothetical protein [Ottowia sp. VDI28]|uniref:hypothetical protein n=1 Tax=Ottowia sp. VDI28 TaxID=3133968 RepID=UPI003C2F863F